MHTPKSPTASKPALITILQTLIAVTAVVFAVQANAADDSEKTVSSTLPKTSAIEDRAAYRPHIGVTAGIANPEGNYETAPEFGIDVGYQPYIPFGLGAMITTSRNDSKNTAHDLERTTVLVRGTYNFGGATPVIKNSWVGIAAGPVFRYDGTDIGLAPIVGFDIPIREDITASYLSLGADARYLAVSGGAADTFSVNGVVKYWF